MDAPPFIHSFISSSTYKFKSVYMVISYIYLVVDFQLDYSKPKDVLQIIQHSSNFKTKIITLRDFIK